MDEEQGRTRHINAFSVGWGQPIPFENKYRSYNFVVAESYSHGNLISAKFFLLLLLYGCFASIAWLGLKECRRSGFIPGPEGDSVGG